jgi:hypothetical protein
MGSVSLHGQTPQPRPRGQGIPGPCAAVRGFQDAWRVRGPFGDVEIELHPASGSVDAKVREASRRELRHLIYDFKYRDPQTRRVVLEVYARMRGLPASIAGGKDYNFDTGSPGADPIGEALLRAARAGIIVVRRRQVRSIVVALDAPSEQVLGPDSSQDAAADTTSWIGLTLVDQSGTPVPNRPYRMVKPDGSTVDGTLDSNGAAMIMGLDPGNCQIWRRASTSR